MSVKWMWQLWEAFSSHLFLLWRTHKCSRMELQPTFITCAHSEPHHQIEPLDCWGVKLEASFVSHFPLDYFPPNWKHALNCKTKFSGGKLLTAIAFPLSNFVWRCKDAVCRLERKTASWWKILEQWNNTLWKDWNILWRKFCVTHTDLQRHDILEIWPLLRGGDAIP